jgi:transposase
LARGQKKAVTEERTLVWVDESGFYLLPAVQRTYAPMGRTPVLHHTLTNDHLSAISAITPDGRLYMQVQEQPFRSDGVVRFLEHLLHHIPGKLLIIWDGSPIHRSQVIKDFLTRGAAKRIHLERLPGYAPDLNPDEGIWNYLKRVELKNMCCRDLAQLPCELRKATQRLRQKKHVVKACIRQPGYI